MIYSIGFRIKFIRVGGLFIYGNSKECVFVEVFVKCDNLVFIFIMFIECLMVS